MTAATTARRLVVATLLTASAPAEAEDELSDFKATGDGAGWLLPTLTLHTLIHEASHAVAGRMMGARSAHIDLLPYGLSPILGRTSYDWPRRTSGQYAFTSVAPMITSLATLGTCALLFELGVPSSEQVRLPVTEMAFWAWADLTWNLIPVGATKHVESVYDHFRLSAAQRIPFRLLHLGAVGLGYWYLKRANRSIFDGPEQTNAPSSHIVVPLATTF